MYIFNVEILLFFMLCACSIFTIIFYYLVYVWGCMPVCMSNISTLSRCFAVFLFIICKPFSWISVLCTYYRLFYCILNNFVWLSAWHWSSSEGRQAFSSSVQQIPTQVVHDGCIRKRKKLLQWLYKWYMFFVAFLIQYNLLSLHLSGACL